MYTRQSANIRDAQTPQDLTQALANCNAPMAHRGQVAFNGNQFPNQGGVMRPQGNGGGVSGVSRAGPAGGPGQLLRGGVYVPDATQRVPPWGLGTGVGSGQTYPTASFYGGNYYGADAYGNDYGAGAPTSAYLTYLDGGGNYYNGDTYYGAGDSIFNFNEINEGDVFFDIVHDGRVYNNNPWYTTNNNIFNNIAGPTTNNYATYNYGGPTVFIEGDTIINNTVSGPNGTGRNGRDGLDGRDGLAGDPGAAGRDGAPGRPGDPGKDGLIFVDVGGGGGRGRQIRLFQVQGIELELNLVNKQVVTDARFNPDTCFVEQTIEAIQVIDGQNPFKRGPALRFAQAPTVVFGP